MPTGSSGRRTSVIAAGSASASTARSNWAQIEELCEDAYRTVAPKTLIARLDANR